MSEPSEIDTGKRALDRMLFFSDAVFAIVLTLLVLDLHTPSVAPGDATALWDALHEMARPIFAFLGSFALIALWWALHLRTTRELIVFDWPSAIVNLMFLLSIALMPFASSLIGANPVNATAFEFYWGVNAASSISLTLLFLVISRGGGRLMGGIGLGARISRTARSIAPAAAFIVGIWFAARGEIFFSGIAWMLIFPIFFVLRLIQAVFRIRR